MSVCDDELGFEVGMENEPIETQKKEKRAKEVENLCAGMSFPQAGTPGTLETEREFTALRFTSLFSDQRCIAPMRALVSRPPSVLLGKV